jgi:hypothetical protein
VERKHTIAKPKTNTATLPGKKKNHERRKTIGNATEE